MKKGAATTTAASPPPFSDGRRRRRINNNKSPSPSVKDQLLLLNSHTPVLTPTAAMMTTPGKKKSVDWQSVANAALSSASSTTSSRNSRSFSTPRKVMYGKKQLQHATPPSRHLSPSSSVKSATTPRPQKNEVVAAAATAENKNSKQTIITPRTRARSIISALASPGDLLLLTPTTTGEEKTKNKMTTPSNIQLSTAEATLHRLARMTSSYNGKQYRQQQQQQQQLVSSSLDSGTSENGFPTPSQNVRRKRKPSSCNTNADTTMATTAQKKHKRKAAINAQAKICHLDEFDDLESLLNADTIAYNTERECHKRHHRTYGSSSNSGNARNTKTIVEKSSNTTNNAGVLDGGTTITTPTTPNSDNSVTVDIIIETKNNDNKDNKKIILRGGRKKMTTNDDDDDGQWLHNFRKWRTLSSEGDLHTRSNNINTATTASSLPVSWMNEQRIQYRKLQCGDKSNTMTLDRAALLEGAGFVWEVARNDNGGCSSSSSSSSSSSNDETHMKSTEELMIDRSLSPGEVGRKSPRKSLPTQFYHNSLVNTKKGENSGDDMKPDRVKQEDVTNNSNNLGKGRSKVISIAALRRFGALPSSSASPIISQKKYKQQVSNSSISKKRTSPSESLASLPVLPDAITKADDDDKQEKSSKKKRRRGRHSTSSLLSFNADEVRNEKDKVLSGGKGLGTLASEITFLSHKELEEVLSKSKKKQRVQKKIKVDGSVKRDNDSSTGAKSNLLSDMPHDEETEFEASAIGDYDVSSSQSPVSPLCITRLLPALMNSDTTTVRNKKKDVAGGSSKKLSRKETTDATVDAPSISQLLMSCLSSEDSAEKKKKNAKVHPPSSSSPSSSLLPFCAEKKLTAGVRKPGSPLRCGHDMSLFENTSNDPDESISQQQVAPLIDAVAGEKDMPTPEKRMRGRPRKYVSSKVDGGDKTKLADEYPLPQCTMVSEKISQTNDTNIEDTVADMEECSIDENSITQTNDTNIEDTTATITKALNHCTIWTCDICRVAEFDDYFHAEEHEKECAIANNLQEIPPPSEEYGRSRSPPSPLIDKADELQSPPSPLPSPAHFSPVTLSSLKHGSGYQTSHHRAATKSSAATSLVLGGENRQLSVPSGSQARETLQHQMIVTQNIHAGLTEYGRLQLESQLVTKRMREIEEEINLRSNKLSYSGNIDDIATSSRKRSYRAESRSASIKHQRHYEYSEEEYSDDYYLPRKRRRLNHVHDDYINQRRGYSGERLRRRPEMRISTSKATMKKRSVSRSGRYNESEMEMGISHRSKQSEQYRADRSYSPKSNNRRGDKLQRVSRSNMPDETHHIVRAKRKLKGYNTVTRDVTARPRQTQAIKQMNTSSKQYPMSSLERASPADSLVSYELPSYSHEEEEEERPPRSDKSRGKAHQRNDREPVNHANMSRSVPNFEGGTNYSDKASPIDSPGKSKGGSTIIPAQSSNFQVIRTKDPMTWLAEEENSSDDESWDFDGPMILPPSPIF